MKSKKTLSLIVIGLLLGAGSVAAMQVAAQKQEAAKNVKQVGQNSETSVSSTVETGAGSSDTFDSENVSGDNSEKDDIDEKDSVDKKDGIDHQFEGDEGDHQD